MPVVEYGKDDDELLHQTMKHDVSDDADGYSVIVTVPSNASQNLLCFGFFSHLHTFVCRLVVVWSSHKQIETGSGMPVIWTWSNRTLPGTRYMPALYCYLLTF